MSTLRITHPQKTLWYHLVDAEITTLLSQKRCVILLHHSQLKEWNTGHKVTRLSWVHFTSPSSPSSQSLNLCVCNVAKMKLFLLTSWYCLYLWHDIPCEYMKLSDYKEENSLIIQANLPRLCAVLTNLSLCINSNQKHAILPVTNVDSVHISLFTQNNYTTGLKNI